MSVQFTRVRTRQDTKMVNINSPKADCWSSSLQFMVTESENSFTVVVIFSKDAAVLAPISAQPPAPLSPEEHVRSIMPGVVTAYEAWRRQGHYPISSTKAVILAVRGNDQVRPIDQTHVSQVDSLKTVLNTFGLPVLSKYYDISDRNGDSTTVIVHGHQGMETRIYVNDQVMAEATESNIPGPATSQPMIRGTEAYYAPPSNSPPPSYSASIITAGQGEDRRDEFAHRTAHWFNDLTSRDYSLERAIRTMAIPLQNRFALTPQDAQLSISILLSYNEQRQSGTPVVEVVASIIRTVTERYGLSAVDAANSVYNAFERDYRAARADRA